MLALAVSGGPDSMAMLMLAAAAFPGQTIAATVDHGLRVAAADEAALVAGWCREVGIAHATLVSDQTIGATAIQQDARAVRYDLLERWAAERKATLLATAHHADDQAETFLMRAARGSGVAGLSGIRERRDDVGPVPVIRPLLAWRHAELRSLAETAALPFVDDPSNADDRFERTRVRRTLADIAWLDAAQLARAARHVGEANDALAAIETWVWRSRLRERERSEIQAIQHRIDLADLPRELRRRIARTAIRDIRMVDGLLPDFDMATNIEPLLDSVEAGRAATQAGVLVSRAGDLWHFRAAPPHRSR